jgi:glutaredoxin-like protein NrdH
MYSDLPWAKRTAAIPLIQNPDGTWTSSDPAWAHLINRESGGNPTIVNTTDSNAAAGNPSGGLFQITPQTWAAHGGSQYGANPGQATPQQQAEVAERIFRKNPSGSDWGAGMAGREDAGALGAGLGGANSPSASQAPGTTTTTTGAPAPHTPTDTSVAGQTTSDTEWMNRYLSDTTTGPIGGSPFAGGKPAGGNAASGAGAAASNIGQAVGDIGGAIGSAVSGLGHLFGSREIQEALRVVAYAEAIMTRHASVTVYTKPGCPQCDATTRHLKRRGHAFETVDLTTNPQALEHARALGHTAAPVVIAGDESWAGYRPDRIDALGTRWV